MNREQALELIRANVKNENLVKHMIATEAIMKALAARFNGDGEKWGMAGLLHDIDVELCNSDLAVHGKMGVELLREKGIDEDILQAIICHNPTLGVEAQTDMDKALFCADPLTGLITAAALVRPDKQLAGVEVKSVRKRFKEKSFAAGANREQIAMCSVLDIELNEFLEIGLTAMKEVSDELGL